MYLKLCSLSLILFILTACEGGKTYSLEALEENRYNNLELPVAKEMERADYLNLFEQFQGLSVEELTTKLSQQAINLQEASFGFYYLANAYAKANQMDKALFYHTLAAEHYLNPLSYLKLAEREYFLTKNFAQAFRYLHHALEITLEITHNNRSHPIAQSTKDKSQFLLQELEQLATQGAFDRKAIWTELKKVMPTVVQHFREMYQLNLEELQ